ncbi:MAG: hypothetical protein JSW39_16930 [Desulfobacterales bacterium]|nr:MAG: hypothetical protein JSW39_16930 [Desulfobacterales bacterium]
MLPIIIFLVLMGCYNAGLAQDSGESSVELVTEGEYLMPAGSSKPLARALALFEAQKKAVEAAGKYLSSRRLIDNYELKKEEIYSLTARRVRSEILAEDMQPVGQVSKYHIRIRARIRSSDYIESDFLDERLENEEAQAALKEALEPAIAPEIDPGLDLSKAYRLLRHEKLRPAMIYLDRLETKYPNWGAVHMAKAIGYYLLREPLRMKASLQQACTLGSANACADLKSLKRVHQFDLETEKFD